MTQDLPPDLKSFCRQCGGDRNHECLAEKSYPWEKNDPVRGCDTWSMLRCCGCDTVTFVHAHWFSEDCGEDYPFEPKLYRDLYPPSPRRKYIEWDIEKILSFSDGEFWIHQLYRDIYNAAGINSFALAAMGARTIIDHVVTSKSGMDKGNFKDKLSKLVEAGHISASQVETYWHAFDAGSAAAHRGYRPDESNFYTLIDIAEDLLDIFYFQPARKEQLVRDAQRLKEMTPQRPRLSDRSEL